MILYAIKVVPPEWQDTMPLPFAKSTHDSAQLEQGTRVLIYRHGEGIVGEGEIINYAVQPSEWSAQSTAHLPPRLAHSDYLQPLKLLYTREDAITPNQVRKALNDSAFPASDDAWQPIDRDVYQQLANWPY